jgi:hypothetical protein
MAVAAPNEWPATAMRAVSIRPANLARSASLFSIMTSSAREHSTRKERGNCRRTERNILLSKEDLDMIFKKLYAQKVQKNLWRDVSAENFVDQIQDEDASTHPWSA